MTLARLPGWERALGNHIASRGAAPFVYGATDCGLFVADTIRAMTGVDVAAPLRGYKTRSQAFAAIKTLCGAATMEAIADYLAAAHGLPRVAVSMAQRGDPLVLKTGRRSTLGIVDMSLGYLLTPYRYGLLRLPLSLATKAYHI